MLSIITALYNRLDLTRGFLDSLLAHPPPEPWEMIWVDDGSTDGTREWLGKLTPPRHKVILNSQNLGFASNNNLAAKVASGDTLVLLNNDVLLTAGWFEPLAESLATLPKIGVIGNVQLVPATGLIDHAGTFFDLVGRPGHHLKNQSRRSLNPPGVFSDAVTAACWMVKKEVFFSAGGFDEAYLNGGEDFDLCLRLGEMGFRHWVDHRSVIWHHVSSSPGRLDHNLRNQTRFLKRWGSHASELGRRDWPRRYLLRALREPRKLNVIKVADALLRIIKLRRGDSMWAKALRDEIVRASPASDSAFIKSLETNTNDH